MLLEVKTMLHKSILLMVLFCLFQSAAFSEDLFSIIENQNAGSLLKLVKAIRAGADINQPGENGMTPLMHAAAKPGNEQLMKALTKHGAKVDARDNNDLTALMRACNQKDNERAIEILIDAGADPNLVTKNQLSAMNFAVHIAVHSGAYEEPRSVKTVELLLKHGAYLTEENSLFQQVWLLAASSEKGLPLIRELLAPGVDINRADDHGVTALMEAAMNNPDPSMTAFLLNSGARVDLISQFGYSALSYASKSNNGEIVRLLLQQTEKLNKKWVPENQLLLSSALNKDPGVIKQFLAFGMKVNCTDERGRTPLMNAARFSTPAIVKILLDAGADVNHRDDFGFSALMTAAEMNVAPEIIGLLIDAGARKDFKEKQMGKSALDFALENENLKNSEIIKLLR